MTGMTRKQILLLLAIIFILIITIVLIVVMTVMFSSGCEKGYTGDNCDECDSEFHKKVNVCAKGKCNQIGTMQRQVNGTCLCKGNFNGSQCDICLKGYSGENCDNCEAGYYKSNTSCLIGDCNPKGTSQKGSDGLCSCNPSYVGDMCDHCRKGYHKDNGICLGKTYVIFHVINLHAAFFR